MNDYQAIIDLLRQLPPEQLHLLYLFIRGMLD